MNILQEYLLKLYCTHKMFPSFNAKKILHIGKNESFFGSCADYEASAVGRRFLGENAPAEHCANCAHHHHEQEEVQRND